MNEITVTEAIEELDRLMAYHYLRLRLVEDGIGKDWILKSINALRKGIDALKTQTPVVLSEIDITMMTSDTPTWLEYRFMTPPLAEGIVEMKILRNRIDDRHYGYSYRAWAGGKPTLKQMEDIPWRETEADERYRG